MLPIGAIWIKYDPINGWQDYASHTEIFPGRTTVKLDLKDGDYGDADGIENGIIVDPSGFGSQLTTDDLAFSPFTDSGSDDDEDDGSSGGGICFIDTLTVE